MPRSLTDPQTLRMLVLGALRLASIGLLAWGAIQLGTRLTFGLLTPGPFSDAWESWRDIGETHGVFRGIPILLVGAALAGASRPLTHWVIRAPAQGCPRCGHDTSSPARDSASPRCTECGYRLAT